ncbi:MAG: hypothetical protein IKM32_07175 [Clostridia bacterium]|nr:hypothetical protein [Clostridia bacterium]
MTDKILDNMTGQEIKELITKKQISIESLDASALNKLINYETDMLCFGNGDIEFICRCSDQLDIISNNPITDDEFCKAIENAKLEYENNFVNNPSHKNTNKKHIGLRRVGLIAAILAILIAGTTLVAAAFGINIFEYIIKMGHEPEGTYVSADSFTFYNAGETKHYSSIEELVKTEHLNIMYPSGFPENIYIKSVRISASEIGENNIMILTSDSNVLVDINTNVTEINSTFNEHEIYQSNGITYYIFEDVLYNRYNAYCIHNNVEYVISANNYDNLLTIINNMKE